ncbi:MAG: hypothetical protein ICV65_00425 [Flavisolibacter sp.]|nr:hypothetical protein [Flavisolibacter sp.]
MNKNFNIINPQALIKAMEHVERGEFGQLSNEDFEIEQCDVQPLEGYAAPTNFPDCCSYHKTLLQIGKDSYNSFPDCCAAHQRLSTAPWFRKEKYAYLPEKLVNTMDYTRHCILTSIDNEDWYKRITDYIDETKASYGQLPAGYGPPVGLALYISNLEKYIECESKIPNDKKQKLLEYLQRDEEEKAPVEQTDLNLLVSKYREWLKIFPFDLSFFRELKPYFEKQLPFLSGPGVTNMYSGLTGFKLVSKEELIGFLVSTTLSIVKELNTWRLLKLGLLQQNDSLKMELILAKRKLELEELDKTNWKDRRQYIKLLKKWIKGEKQFVSEIIPLIKNVPHPAFIQDVIDGIKQLQMNDSNELCIRNVRENLPDKESSFRNYFKTFFSGRYPGAAITAEEEKGKGRIDLKIWDKVFVDKIIEFKGWWNQDKSDATKQICSYLTDFEQTGYIFMINNRKKNITEDYKKIVTSDEASYVPCTWKEHRLEGTDFSYYESSHQFGVHQKQIYHFIFNVWF